MTLPNFLVIGASKSGTSSLSNYLSQHPQIFMSPLGEPRFFSFDEKNPTHWEKVPNIHPITNLDEYERLFDGVTTETAIGEKSPGYLNNQLAPERIKQTLPGVRLIAILRNPIDRAYSELQMDARAGRYHGPIPPDSVSPHDLWIKRSMYYEKIKRYYDTFPQNQIRVFLFEDFVSNTNNVLQQIYQFLDVDIDFKAEISIKVNQGGIKKYSFLYSMLKHRRSTHIFKPFVPTSVRRIYQNLREKNMKKAPPLSDKIRQQLGNLFRSDILQLQELLCGDLSHWI